MPQHPRRSRVVVAALLALLAFVAVPLTSASAKKRHGDRHAISIAKARTLPLGTVVTIEGTVTTPAGAFASSFFDEGFGVQDATAGIFVSFPDTNIGVQPPRHVVVTGVLKDSDGLLVIAPASPHDVKVKGKDEPVQPIWVRTGSVGDSTEGSIVRVVAFIKQAPFVDQDFGHKFTVDDGSGELNVFVNLGTNADVSNLAAGQLIDVTGFSSEFDGTPEIDIRSQADLALPVK